jgi:hypothetical protein
MAPAFTIGFMVRLSFSSTAITESNGRPVAFTPSLRRATPAPTASHTSAKVNAFEMLWIENGWSTSPTPSTAPRAPTTQMPNHSGFARASAGM